MLDEVDVYDVIQGPLSKGLPLFKVPFEGVWIGIGKVVLDILPGSLCDRDHKGLLEGEYKEVGHRTERDFLYLWAKQTVVILIYRRRISPIDLWHLGRAMRRGERMSGKFRLNFQDLSVASLVVDA